MQRRDAGAAGAEAQQARCHGVVFVHGVGPLRKSDTLLDFGNPLLRWLETWCAARGEAAPRVGPVELSFAPFDAGDADCQSRAVITLPDGVRWVLVEAWWAGSSRSPDFATMVQWSLGHLAGIVQHLVWASKQRLQRLLRPDSYPTAPNLLARLVDLVNTIGLLILYPIAAVLGYSILLPLMVLAQIPIPAVQQFVLIQLIGPFLQVNAGEFRTYLDDDLQAANMRRRVADAVRWLVDPARGDCSDVTLVGHSQGAVVSFGLLADPAFGDVAQHVRKLVTFGAGLNKAWDAAPGLARLHGPIAAHVHWLDLWASYDPVPDGWLQPPVLASGQWAPIYRPDRAVVTQQHLVPRSDPNPDPGTTSQSAGRRDSRYWPVSEQVTNEMNVLSDHGSYVANDEQVVVRLAAEIDCGFYRDSVFWRGDARLAPGETATPELRAATRARRTRVSVLAAARAATIVVALWLIGVYWSGLLAYRGSLSAFMEPLAQESLPTGIVSVVAGSLVVVARVLAVIPALGSWMGWLLTLPLPLVGALAIGLAFVVLYQSGRALVWDPYDGAARKRAIRAIATAGRGPAPPIS